MPLAGIESPRRGGRLPARPLRGGGRIMGAGGIVDGAGAGCAWGCCGMADMAGTDDGGAGCEG